MEILGFIGFGVVLLLVAWVLDTQVKNAQRNDRSYSGSDSGSGSEVW